MEKVDTSDRVLCKGVAARYALMKEMRLEYSIQMMCRIYDVSASGPFFIVIKRLRHDRIFYNYIVAF